MHLRALLPIALLCLTGCETTRIAPVSDNSVQLEQDERRLWARSREEQETLNHSGFLVDDPQVEAYLNLLLGRLQHTALPDGGRLQAHVLKDPTLNAFALPDGALYIHTGMLARLENEAQLAIILSHELTHSTHRHALRGYRNLKNQAGFLATVTVGTGGIGGLLGGLGAMSAISGYSQDLEREADEKGFQLYLAAGYDPRECAKVFRTLLAESARSKIKEPFFFGSHPRLQERIASFDTLVARLPAAQRQGETKADAYTAVMAPLFLVNATAALYAGDQDFASESAKRYLQSHPEDPAASLLIAETHRKRGGEKDEAKALELYRELAARPEAPPEAHRGLGLMLFKLGQKTAAAVSFRRYLELLPAAPDRTFIENYLLTCEK